MAVENCTPNVPVNTCSVCPLNIDNVSMGEEDGCPEGDFINCGRMFHIDSDECKGALKQWADQTPCDDLLPYALDLYYNENPDEYNYDKDWAA